MPSTSDAAGWRAQLGFASPAAPDERATLGLLFQLRTLTRDGSQWTAPKAEAATAVHRDRTQRLAVRPALLGERGRWTTSEIGWATLGFKSERLRLDPRQVAWLTQFAALHRATGEGYRAAETDWLYLDEFASPLLWPLLDAAPDADIAFVAGKSDTNVEVLPRAEARVEIAPDRGSAVRVEPHVEIEGVPFTPTGRIGDHGLYACAFDPDLRVQFAPATPAAVDLADWRGTPVRVPAADAAEFWHDHFPSLTRRLPVEGRGMELPEVRTETVLVVEFLPKDIIETRWESRIGSIREPLEDPPEDVPRRLEGADAAEFAEWEIPRLQAEGVRVVLLGEQPAYRELTEPARLQLTAVPTEGNDWLDLGFVITVGSYTVNFADVFAALSRGRSKLLLVDKTYLSLDQPVFDLLRELIEEGTQLREWETGAIVSRYHAPRFEPFEDDADERPAAVMWRRTASAFTAPPPEIAAPTDLRAELRPYQLAGFQWLAHLWQHGLGGVLADDMGLGKTVQTIALLTHAATTAPDPQRFLIVAPTSVLGTWRDELARFAPDLSVASVSSMTDPLPDDATVVVTSYAIFRLAYERFAAVSWSGLVLDEAQYVKNPTSQVHDCALALDARVKFALTGTPLENGLMDLWAIFRITAPGLFASRIRFSGRYVKAHSSARLAELRRRIRPLMLRRTKQLVALELPPKQEHIVQVDLDPAHRDLYERHLQRERQKVLGLVDDLDRNRFIVFRSITLLRLLALDPRLIAPDGSEDHDVPSAKLDELVERILQLAAEGRRALVFSQFTTYLGLVRKRLEDEGISYEYLDGATTKRPQVIANFRFGTANVFLISLRAGGVGLTLTEADTVFLLDPWWNPAAEAQAIDRTHRIGQDDPVMVYRLVARDTVEEKVLALGDAKRALFDEVIDGGDAFSTALTADDIRALLG